MKKKPSRKTFDKSSHLEEALFIKLITMGEEIDLCRPGRNCRYLQPTAFEFDFSWTSLKIAIEVQGGLHLRRGGHTSHAGIRRDQYKLALAQSKGWILLQFPPEVCTDAATWRIWERMLKACIKQRRQVV